MAEHGKRSCSLIANAIPTEQTAKRINILNNATYEAIVQFIKSFRGLTIDCEQALIVEFPHIDEEALKDITQVVTRYRSLNLQTLRTVASSLAKELMQEPNSVTECDIMYSAIVNRLNPMKLCRAVLKNIKIANNFDLKNPFLIQNTKIADQVIRCMVADSQEGPLVDLCRNLIGLEYEALLDEWVQSLGLPHISEKEMRKKGFDKTPDVVLHLPILYKGSKVSWIESKGYFGDPKTHKRICQKQLSSYVNRFGQGIVIYWHGYHEDTPILPENMGIIVLATFPNPKDIVSFDLEDTLYKKILSNDEQHELEKQISNLKLGKS